ncbi:luciferin 4-monooxygenase-like [Arctopsyche grandis]|uniref:luciferin 4-monooxygenase-like n=1 Tax=Arctopsyche grandis TaxID=121162 RepID=UPI00406D6B27
MLKEHEDEVHQIEITTGKEETHGSVRIRSIRMALSLKSKGIKKGDVILICAVNHNDICIPFIASLYLGAVPFGLATDMKHREFTHFLSLAKPSLIFADPGVAPVIHKATSELDCRAEIVTFGSEEIEGFSHFSEFVEPITSEEDFECEDFDPKTTMALLVCSSGTTGLPKLIMHSHYALFVLVYSTEKLASELKLNRVTFINYSPLIWISGSMAVLTPFLLGHKLLQSIRPFSPEDFQNIPTMTMLNQMTLSSILNYAESQIMDLSNFRIIHFGGCTISDELLRRLKKIVPNVVLTCAYGITEVMIVVAGMILKKNSCGKVSPLVQWKIADVETGKTLGPNQPGEFRIKCSHMFMGYYNNPEATAAAFDEDNWFKTGDLMYYDEEEYFYMLDRIKQLIKYRHFHISCSEIEKLICDIPGVLTAGIVGVPHPEDGEHVMAFVQLVPGGQVSAQEIKDFVKANLSNPNQLRAGVVFLEKIPLTNSGKLDRQALKALKTIYKGE